ncbi:MAG: CDC48 family AAA ATPase [Candidatus Diapherotrites archaeon]|nr:CDC48 family AAA ATPase [Candidatus Diapherotrites archaeon]
MPEKSIELKVADPDPTHVGRNIVTLDRETKQALSITSGDIVEVEGTKKTAAVVWPARAEDEGKKIVRMDNFIRHNAGVGLGEKVAVRKCEPKEAKKVVLAPSQEIRIIASGFERILKKNFLGRPLTIGDSVWISVFGSGFVYRVIDTNPRGIVKVTDFTQFSLKEKPVKGELEAIPRIAYEDIGGLDELIQKVREMVELPMKHPELFRRLGIVPPKGVLLHGPPGCGKTLLAKAVANETQAHFISVNAPEVMSKYVGEAEERIRQMFKDAEENAPSIIFIDEIDAIAPKREEVLGEVERRVVAQILALMDGLEARGNVIVIAATNRVNSIDEALRRPGRFDREIEFPVPTKDARKEVLAIHTRGMPIHPPLDFEYLRELAEKENGKFLSKQTIEQIAKLVKKPCDEKEFFASLDEKAKAEVTEALRDKMLEYFASITHGFVGADLAALAKEAAMKALRRYLPKIDLEDEKIPPELLESMEVNKRDFINGLKDVQPSALREVTIEVPNVKWSDIGGLDEAKEELKQAVEWPLKYPDSFKKMGIRPPSGILLYGPSGCGKTLLAKAVATESEANFISIKGPELLSMWVGESERGVRKVFRRARQVAPCIVFFDEIDSIAGRRGMGADSHVTERVVNQLLTELDGIEQNRNVVFLAATNRPDLLDPGLLRPGRIDKLIKIDASDEKGRLAIFKVHTKNVTLAKDVSLEELAKKTAGFSGADIEGLVREAALIALKENKLVAKPVEKKHLEQALAKAKASISPKVEEAYDEFEEHLSEFKPSYVG